MALHEPGVRTEDARTATTVREPGTRRTPETKTFLASSEFWVAAGAIVALFIGGYWLDDIRKATTWQYATWVAIGYIVSRGIAKAGSHRAYQRDARDYYDVEPVRVPPRQSVVE